jgi:hypothetical protein
MRVIEKYPKVLPGSPGKILKKNYFPNEIHCENNCF